MGTPEAIQEDVRWPTAQADALMSACSGLADLLEGQVAPRQAAANRAQEEFRGAKANQFDDRLRINGTNAGTLIGNLRAMRSALSAAENWAHDEQAARERARRQEDDRRWFGLKGVVNDILD